jgi:hypothetical protein
MRALGAQSGVGLPVVYATGYSPRLVPPTVPKVGVAYKASGERSQSCCGEARLIRSSFLGRLTTGRPQAGTISKTVLLANALTLRMLEPSQILV